MIVDPSILEALKVAMTAAGSLPKLVKMALDTRDKVTEFFREPDYNTANLAKDLNSAMNGKFSPFALRVGSCFPTYFDRTFHKAVESHDIWDWTYLTTGTQGRDERCSAIASIRDNWFDQGPDGSLMFKPRLGTTVFRELHDQLPAKFSASAIYVAGVVEGDSFGEIPEFGVSCFFPRIMLLLDREKHTVRSVNDVLERHALLAELLEYIAMQYEPRNGRNFPLGFCIVDTLPDTNRKPSPVEERIFLPG